MNGGTGVRGRPRRGSPAGCSTRPWNVMAANDPKPIQVRVLFFGAARDAVGCDCLKIQINSAATVAGAFAQLLADYPALSRFGNSLLLAVNHEYALPDRRLSDYDEL